MEHWVQSMPREQTCTICGKDLDGTITPDQGWYAHAECFARRARARERLALLHEKACGECASCEQGHGERCGKG